MTPEQNIRAALSVIHAENPLVELRPIMPDGRWWTGLFDDKERLVQCVLGLNHIEATAVYWTLNSISPSLAHRVTNSVGPAKRGQCIKNADIDRIRWLFLDYDCKGTFEDVEKLAGSVERFFQTLQPGEKPLYIRSGTGIYHLYRVDLPAGEKKFIRDTVNNLATRFDSAGAIIDRKCANPARIARVPGTFNRKARPIMASFGVDHA